MSTSNHPCNRSEPSPQAQILALLVAALCACLLFAAPAFAQLADDGGGEGGEAQGERGWWQGKDPGEFANGVLRRAHCDIRDHIEGNFGALLMTTAGIVGLGMAAFGRLQASLGALATAIGCFGMTAMISLYFGDFCGGAGGGDGGGQGRQSSLEAALDVAIGTRSSGLQFIDSAPEAPEFDTGQGVEAGDDPFSAF